MKPELPLKEFAPPRTLHELAEIIATTLVEVRARAIPGNANSVAILGNVLMGILKASGIEERLARVEAADAEIRRALNELRQSA